MRRQDAKARRKTQRRRFLDLNSSRLPSRFRAFAAHVFFIAEGCVSTEKFSQITETPFPHPASLPAKVEKNTGKLKHLPKLFSAGRV
jgi:hypothetical protein